MCRFGPLRLSLDFGYKVAKCWFIEVKLKLVYVHKPTYDKMKFCKLHSFLTKWSYPNHNLSHFVYNSRTNIHKTICQRYLITRYVPFNLLEMILLIDEHSFGLHIYNKLFIKWRISWLLLYLASSSGRCYFRGLTMKEKG